MGIKAGIIVVVVVLAWWFGDTIVTQFQDGAKYQDLKVDYDKLQGELVEAKDRNVNTAKEVMGKCDAAQAREVAKANYKATVKSCKKLIRDCRALAQKEKDEIMEKSKILTQ